MKKLLLLSSVLILGLSSNAHAKKLFSDTSISVLHGDEYKLASQDGSLNTITLEHVSGHNWGGVFFFVDRHTNKEPNYKEVYGEISPKFNLVKFDDSFIKNVNFAVTHEFGSKRNFDFNNYLYGLGIDLKIPGMDYASLTYYRATNEFGDDDDQITTTYSWTKGRFNLSGYIDYSTATKNQDEQLHFNPQVTFNVGPADSKIKVGFEYSYWSNKFGIKNLDNEKDTQSVISGLLKVHI